MAPPGNNDVSFMQEYSRFENQMGLILGVVLELGPTLIISHIC